MGIRSCYKQKNKLCDIDGKITITKHCKVCNNNFTFLSSLLRFQPNPTKRERKKKLKEGMEWTENKRQCWRSKWIPLAKALILSTIYRRESSQMGKESRLEQRNITWISSDFFPFCWCHYLFTWHNHN